MKISCFKDLAVHAKHLENKTTLAVVEANDEHTIESVIKAADDGIIKPLLIGEASKIGQMLSHYTSAASKYTIIQASGFEESLKKAVELIHSGAATAIMKGNLESGQFMKAIVSKDNALLTGDKLSLIGLYETPQYHKIFAITDMGLNTYPDLEGKRIIINNAVKLLHALGNDNPKIAVLSSVEKVNPKMPDAVDGAALKAMNQDGLITGCLIEGPISFDLATCKESAIIKEYHSPVAGDADVLVVPDICAGNILAKCLTGFGGAQTAGTVLGAKVPVILTSRSAEAADKYYSIALAACAAESLKVKN